MRGGEVEVAQDQKRLYSVLGGRVQGGGGKKGEQRTTVPLRRAGRA
jgi:hypothetical protein